MLRAPPRTPLPVRRVCAKTKEKRGTSRFVPAFALLVEGLSQIPNGVEFSQVDLVSSGKRHVHWFLQARADLSTLLGPQL